MEQVTRVEILGESYALRAPEDPEYIRRVARFVDQKLAEAVQGGGDRLGFKAGILASLNIADELFKLREAKAAEAKAAARKLTELVALIDQVLERSS
jgi:cell division protein ZapA (FtsZ GTPase activity inhibitor)